MVTRLGGNHCGASKNRGWAVSLKEKWTASREREREERETWKANQRRYAKRAELRRQGVPVAMPGEGWPDPALTEEALDAMLAAESERRAKLYETFVSARTVTTFRALGVQVLTGDDKVYTIGNHDAWAKTNDSRLLGPLAGAEAKVTDGTSAFSVGKAMIMPVATAALARKETADALVIFPDGIIHTTPLDGSRAVRDARKQCVEFNVLGGASASPHTETRSDPAVKLRQLKELRDAGLLNQDEYETKRAEIINSI